VALLDLSSLLHKALQLSLGPSHVGHEMALVCHDSHQANEDIVLVTQLHGVIVAFFSWSAGFSLTFGREHDIIDPSYHNISK
jgi:hypothetical protein